MEAILRPAPRQVDQTDQPQNIPKSRKRPTLEQVAERTYTPIDELKRIVEILNQKKQKVSASMVLEIFNGMNRKIEQTKTLGHAYTIGHSYFMRKGLTAEDLDRIWKFNIEPLLNEYFFDDPGQLDYFHGLVKAYD